jgi:DRG Family Regulatory Proteins, Tma46
VLKKDRRKMEKDKEEISIEDLVEKERANLGSTNLTKVTLETFVAWKKKKLREKADAEKKEKVPSVFF